MLSAKGKVQLKVEDIDCPGCATDMESVLLQLDGIEAVAANYARETITVNYDPGITSDKEIISAIRKMGYKAHLL